MKYYIYALIDPKTKVPFYIGKGLYERLKHHFVKSHKTKIVYGADPESILIDAESKCTNNSKKIDKITDLMNGKYQPEDIARIVAKNQDEYSALALEAFLIKFAYGLENLTNEVHGQHSERFRNPGTVGDFIEGFDPNNSISPQLIDKKGNINRYYVYALINPETSQPFYIGKGKGNRIWAHFNSTESCFNDETQKINEIKKLKAMDFCNQQIGRILAYVDNENTAFKIESLLIKFVYGENNLTNKVSGHHKQSYRAKGDWEARKGFDLPFIYEKATRGNREWIKDLMLGEGLGDSLDRVKIHFENTLPFGDYELLNSRDLGIRADFEVNGNPVAKIKVFTRILDQIQVEVRFENIIGQKWAEKHFMDKLGYVNRRKEYVFFPDSWWKKLANGSEDAIERVEQILTILSANNRKEIENFEYLLEEKQQTKNRQQRERFVSN